VCGLIRYAQRNGKVRKGDPARLYYAVIGLGGTLFSVSNEFRILTGRDVFTVGELRQTIDLIFDFLIVP
jgi:TetR/AcrR family transcriptional regulator